MLQVRPGVSRADVERFYADPAIAARIGHDHRPAGYVDHPLAEYLGAWVNGELMGVFLVLRTSALEREIHALLARRALPWSRELGRGAIAHCFSSKTVQRISAPVIECLTSAANYCRKLGFMDEGLRRDACQKDGRLMGVRMLGLTRRDWEKT